MSRKLAAFEIRTNQRLEPTKNPTYEECKILCAAISISKDDATEESFTFYDPDPEGAISDALSPPTCQDLAQALRRLRSSDFTLVSWNGLGHDLNALAHCTEQYDLCRQLALEHHDVMFQVHCAAGFPVSLRAAALAMRIPLGEYREQQVDSAGLWEYPPMRPRLLQEAAADARTTLQVAQRIDSDGEFIWITQRGRKRSMRMRCGTIPVRQALNIPEPRTDWMDAPIPRAEFYQWLR